ncbi:hypothetical protein HN695_01480 [Candidatus Woesearchaeota archaeon]|jgi:hypothetical protein|nr:hypothetical protein [Candidatus Woesearchaeota archaeon]MBT5273071.1 hypothetical protein [Candidatus Woesearchaeota archaeon]MBT6041010.1 hypothetical protein [Candidatus Woesearchaeota archaeon]MBT6337614.1 hypothetical protein [Candidatus Woesearchaeota archaeon]MBT7926985.1 hypothetical protein [Candidatus Woesearchaeota archaeon]
MNEKVRKDIIAVLKAVIVSLEKKDVLSLREISNKIIHSASIFQDEYSISTAVIVFALSKIIQRENLIDVRITTLLQKATHHLQKYQLNKYSNDMKKLINRISKSDSKLDLYIQHVMDEAHVKKASKIYEHGISLGQTAQILGISQWELMRYIGHTKIPESIIEKVSVRSRLKYIDELFGLN